MAVPLPGFVSPEVTVAVKKVRRESSAEKKKRFLWFWDPGGTPRPIFKNIEKRMSSKITGCHRGQKYGFWYHFGSPGGVLGSLVLAPGPPQTRLCTSPCKKKDVREGVRKIPWKNGAEMTQKRGGWNSENMVSYRSVGKSEYAQPQKKTHMF